MCRWQLFLGTCDQSMDYQTLFCVTERTNTWHFLVYVGARWQYCSFPQSQLSVMMDSHFSRANQYFFNNCFLINVVSTKTHSDFILNLCAKLLLCQIFVVSIFCLTKIWLNEFLTWNILPRKFLCIWYMYITCMFNMCIHVSISVLSDCLFVCYF